MSRRRRKTAAAMTLFAFQDIIMSTSGIMILIVLLLSLELIQQRESPAGTVDPAELTPVLESIAAAQAEIAELERQLARGDESVQTASTLTVVELREQLESDRRERESREPAVAELAARVREAEAREPELAERRRFLESLQLQLKSAQATGQELEREITRLEQEDRPVYSMPQGDRREGWLVVVGEQDVQVAPLGRAAAPVAFSSGSGGILGLPTLPRGFEKWVSEHSPREAYYFLLVRPGGVEQFESLTEFFDRRDIAYGFDLAGAYQSILHPQRGAVE